MDNIMQAIATVGFPIVMCGVLCYYIFKVQTSLIDSINENTKALLKLQERSEDDGK